MSSTLVWIELATVGVLFALSAVFSATETALAAVNKARLKKMIEKHPLRARGFRLWLEDPNRLLTTILVGINTVNICAASLTAMIGSQLSEQHGWNRWLVWALTTVGVTVLIIVFCEVAPKVIAIHSPMKTVMKLITTIMFFERLFDPLTRVLVKVTSSALSLFGIRHESSRRVVTQEDIRTLIDVGKEEGAIEKQEGKLLQSVLEFRDTMVREVMVPRNEMRTLSLGASRQEVMDTVIRHGVSRVPVYEGSPDNIVGILYAKDILAGIRDERPFKLADICRPPFFVPETKKISELLLQFQRQRLHQAIAVDEHGGVAGLVTLEDVIEELVGEIRDEYDKPEGENIVKAGEDEYLVRGRTDIDDVNRELGIKLEKTDGVETLGGFVMDYLGSLPQSGKRLKLPSGVTLRVKEVKGVRVESVLVVLPGRKRPARGRRRGKKG